MHIRRFVGHASAFAFAALVATGCSTSSLTGGIPGDAICTVNGHAVAKKSYDKIENQAKKNYKSQKQNFPKQGSPEYKQLRTQGVDFLVEQELFKQKASDLGVKINSKDVDKRLKQLKDSFFKGDEKAYQKELKKQGLSESEVKDNIRQQLLSEKLFEKVTKSIKVSDADAQKYFNQNPAQYKQPESRDVAHILVPDKATADKIYAQVKGGDQKVFAAIAKKQSKDPSSAQNGGALTISRGQTVPEFDKVAFSLKPGQVSPPVKTQFGYHIITARSAIKPASQQKFNDVKAQIKQTLEQEQRSKKMQDWRDKLIADAKKNVSCKKGYNWSKTQKTTTTPPVTTPPSTKGTSTKPSTSTKPTTSTTKK